MILQEYFEIKVAGANKQHYKDKGYEAKSGEIIQVKNEDLPERSRILEDRICDEDGKTYTRTHSGWVDTFKAFGKDLCPACAAKLRVEHMKKTNLERYGVEFPMQSKEIKQKAIDTCIEHYGCEYSFQSSEVQEKAKQSIEEIYGVSVATKNPEVIEKMKRTNLERYGCENVFQNEEIKEKTKQTNLANYGHEYITQSEEIQEKIKQTFQEKYGADYALQVPEFMDKAKQTTFDRYGVEYAMQSPEIRERAMETLCKNGSVPTSSQQIIVFEMLQKLYPESELVLNKQCSDCSLDVELIISPDMKIDVEYDGNHWHTDAQRDRRRDEFLKTCGYKILRIRSKRKVPTNEQIQEAITYLINNKEATFSRITLEDWEDK